MNKQLAGMDLSATVSLTADTSQLTGGNGKPNRPKLPGHAEGLDYVPYNDYVARLHLGEAVLTKGEAKLWRSQQSAKPQIVNIDTESLAASIADAVQNRPVAMNINGKSFAALMAKEMSRSIGNRNIQTLMGMGG